MNRIHCRIRDWSYSNWYLKKQVFKDLHFQKQNNLLEFFILYQCIIMYIYLYYNGEGGN